MFEQRQSELLAALPPVLQQIKELAEICELERPHFAEAWVKTQQILDEQYPHICGEYGLQRWEKMLGIVPSAEADLDKRRRAVLLLLNEQLPFTMVRLRELLARVAPEGGYEVELLPEVAAPVSRGQALGTLTVKSGEQILMRLPLTAEKPVMKVSWGSLFIKALKSMLGAT